MSRILDGVVAAVTRLRIGRFGVWFSTEGKDFTVVQDVNTGSVVHRSSYLMGVEGCFTGGKLEQGVKFDHSAPSPA